MAALKRDRGLLWILSAVTQGPPVVAVEAEQVMARAKKKKSNAKDSSGNGANLGFEATFWLAADKLRSNMDAAECELAGLGLIFLKYISDAVEEQRAKLAQVTPDRWPTRNTIPDQV